MLCFNFNTCRVNQNWIGTLSKVGKEFQKSCRFITEASKGKFMKPSWLNSFSGFSSFPLLLQLPFDSLSVSTTLSLDLICGIFICLSGIFIYSLIITHLLMGNLLCVATKLFGICKFFDILMSICS